MLMSSEELKSLSNRDLYQRAAVYGYNERLAQEVFYQRLGPSILVLAMGYLSDEAEGKEVANRVLDNMLKYPEALKIESVEAFAKTATRNMAIKVLDKARRYQNFKNQPDLVKIFFDEMVNYDPIVGLEDKGQIEKQFEALSLAIQQLSPEQQVAIRLFYFEDLSYKEIMDRTGMSNREVTTKIYTAKKRLRSILLKDQA